MKFYLMHHLRIQPSEIENWDFYEYQYTINNLVEHLKKEKDRHKEEEEKSQEQYNNMNSQVKMAQIGSLKGSDKYMKGISGIPRVNTSGSGLKLPSGSGFKAPSIKVPKL